MRSVTVLFVISVAVDAVSTKPSRIVGGSLATINQYPSMASLLFSWTGGDIYSPYCGGTILNSRSILTAAHCTFSFPESWFRIRGGSTYTGSGGIVYNVATIFNHPEYDGDRHNDIAVVHVIGNIAISNQVRPASIAGPDYNLADNEVVWAAGWGAVYYGGPASEHLRHVQVWTVNNNLCRERYEELNLTRTINENILCSGWLDVGLRDQCQGDSGGPVFHNGVVVGVCSWGHECATPRYPGVNARVSSYTSWIQSIA